MAREWIKKDEPEQADADLEASIFREIKPLIIAAGYSPRNTLEGQIKGLESHDYYQYINWFYVRVKQLKYQALPNDKREGYLSKFNNETDNRLETKFHIQNYSYPRPQFEGTRS